MKFIPLGDRVLIKRIEVSEKTKNGLFLPESAKEKPQEGEVLAVGPGTFNKDAVLIPLRVETGDRVLFGKYSGTEITIDDESVLILREEEILGRLVD